MTHLVAVYGSLRQGFENHGMIRHAEYLGEDWLFGITLYDLGPYPGAKMETSEGVLVEVYRVDDSTLKALDQLEDYVEQDPASSLYIRTKTRTRYGEAFIYIYNRHITAERKITSGVWQAGWDRKRDRP